MLTSSELDVVIKGRETTVGTISGGHLRGWRKEVAKNYGIRWLLLGVINALEKYMKS